MATRPATNVVETVKIVRSDNPAAQACPDLPIYKSITFGRMPVAWQADRQTYLNCQQRHKALIDQIATKERGIEGSAK